MIATAWGRNPRAVGIPRGRASRPFRPCPSRRESAAAEGILSWFLLRRGTGLDSIEKLDGPSSGPRYDRRFRLNRVNRRDRYPRSSKGADRTLFPSSLGSSDGTGPDALSSDPRTIEPIRPTAIDG